MSDYGLIVRNNNSEIQIDSTYRNFSKVSEGSGATISNGGAGGPYFTDIAIASSPLVPVILIRPNTNHPVALHNYNKSGSNFVSFSLITRYGYSTTIDWKCYRESSSPSFGIYGLQVFNPSGGLCFDSEKDYFKVHSVHQISLASNNYNDYEDVVHSGISNPFYILSPAGFICDEAPLGGEDFRTTLFQTGLLKLSSTSVRVKWVEFYREDAPYSGTAGVSPTAQLIVCDVT